MSNSRKLLFIISFFIIDVCLLGGIFLIRDITLKNVLRKEVNALVELDLLNNSYNVDIKSNGNYIVVEKAIKEYLGKYTTEVQNVLNMKNDDKLNNLLTISNYKEDGPLFYDSLKYIDNMRTNFNNKINLLIDKDNEKYINEYIYNYVSNKKYIEIYNQLLINSNLISKINENKRLLENERFAMNSYFNSIYNVLMLLQSNQNSYTIVEEDKIVFNDSIIEKEYYELVEEVKRIYN